MGGAEIVLSLPVLLTVVLALRYRISTALAWFIPSSVIANPYLAAAALLISFLLRLLPGREPLSLSGMSIVLSFVSVWMLAALLLLPSGQGVSRWFSEIIQLTLGLSAMLFVRATTLSQKDVRLICKGMVAAAVILAAYSILRGGAGLGVESSSLIGSKPDNYAALLITLGLVVTISGIAWRHRIGVLAKIAICILLLAGVYYNESRASLVVAMLCVGIGFFLTRPVLRSLNLFRVSLLVVVSTATTIGVVLWNPELAVSQMLSSTTDFEGGNFSNMERLFLLLQSYELFLENPLGHGIGSSSGLLSESVLTRGSYYHPHNTLAMFAIELGVTGILIYLALLGFFIRAFMIGIRSANANWIERDRFLILAPIVFVLSTVYEALMFNGALWTICCLLLGLLLTLSDRRFKHASCHRRDDFVCVG